MSVKNLVVMSTGRGKEKKSMIGIIGAMSVEMEAIKGLMDNKQDTVISGITFTTGQIHGKGVVAAVCGIGKVFAGMCTQTMILQFAPKQIINVGVAGTLTKDLGIADIAIADNMVEHDMDTSAIGDPVGLISGINIIEIPCDEALVSTIENCVQSLSFNTKRGTIASGDQFVADKAKKEYIVNQFGAIACEMEGAAIGQVCYVNKVPFAVIRAISDSADNQSHMDYPEFVKIASANSTKVMEKLITML